MRYKEMKVILNEAINHYQKSVHNTNLLMYFMRAYAEVDDVRIQVLYKTGLNYANCIPSYKNFDTNSINGLIRYIKYCEAVMDDLYAECTNERMNEYASSGYEFEF